MNLEPARVNGKSLKTGINPRLLFLIIGVSLLTAAFAMSNKAQTPLDGFNPDASGKILAIAIASDGKIVVGGQVTAIGGQSVGRIARLNADGTLDTSFSANLNNTVRAIAFQADGKILVGGDFTTVNGQAKGYFARLSTNGTLDTTFTAIANNSVFTITPRLINENILVGGDFTTMNGASRQRLARLSPNGSLDPNFAPDINQTVYSVKELADGYILIAGYFSQVNGQTRVAIARLNNSGTLDTSFNLNADDIVNAITVQPDHKVLIGGFFTSIQGSTRNHIARLNADGTLDPSFNPNLDGSVTSITLQTDGRILVYGFFNTVGGQSRDQLARLNNNGSLDTTFGEIIFNHDVETVAVQSNGNVLVGGNFSTAASTSRNRIARFDRFGNLERRFEPNPDQPVFAVAVQNDGDLYIGGAFNNIAGAPKNFFAALDAKGTLKPLDLGLNGAVKTLSRQADGKTLLGGDFTTMAGASKFHLGRLNPNGTVDTAFAPNINGSIKKVRPLENGKILILGSFTVINGSLRKNIAVLENDGTLDPGFEINTDGEVQSNEIEPDGSIVIGGTFATVNGSAKQNLARVLPGGTVDPTFSPPAGPGIKLIKRRADGSLLIVRGAPSVAGSSIAPSAVNFVETIPSGGSSTSPMANATTDGTINTIVEDAAGELSIAGSFSVVNGAQRNNYADLTSNGSNKPGSSNLNVTGEVHSITKTPSSKILVGNFPTILQEPVKNLAKVGDTEASVKEVKVTIAPPSPGPQPPVPVRKLERTIRGSANVPKAVSFASSTDGGTTFTDHGRAYPHRLDTSLFRNTAAGVQTEEGVTFSVDVPGLQINQEILIKMTSLDEDTGSVEEEIFTALINPPVAQTITVSEGAPSAAYIGSKFDVAATASSGLPVGITAAGNCSVFSGGTNGSATIIMGGALTDCTINYDQAGDGTYDPAPTVTSSTTAEDCPVISTANISSLTNVPITVPVSTSALSNATSPSIFAATLTFTFDPAVLQFVNAVPGAVASGASIQANPSSPGTVQVSLSSTTALNGSGSLVDLNFDVIGAIGSTSPLTVSSFQFNEANTLAVCSTIAPAGFLTVESGTVTGNVNYANGAGQPNAVPGVTINAAGTTAVSDVSDANGDYLLANFGAGSYSVTPAKPRQADPNNGFSAGDASLIAQHVVGIVTLSGNQAIAGDVTEDGTISSLDAAFVAQYIVGIVNPNNRSGIWRFTPNLTTPDTTVHSVQNYDANLLGDVNGSWSNTGTPLQVRIREEDPAVVSVANRKAAVNSIAVVPFKIEDLKGRGITSYQFEVKYDPAALEPVENAAGKSGTISENMFVVSNAPEPGLLKVVVFDALPVTGDGIYLNLKFRVTGKIGASTKLEIRNLLVDDGALPTVITNAELLLTDPETDESFRGRVLSTIGIGIGGARILLESTSGEQFEAYTDILGRFQVAGLTPGETYSVSVEAKSHKFNRQVISITENMTEIELIAQQ
ncbi:MAG: hypothetical protein KIS76_08740 [Pyrinomonadaceae bacterium]|nr:hypothetical protein [Pyrinomonadaceae bacterium]